MLAIIMVVSLCQFRREENIISESYIEERGSLEKSFYCLNQKNFPFLLNWKII